MLHHLLENANFGDQVYLQGSVMNAADRVLQWGNLGTLKILISDARVGSQLRDLEFFRLIIQRWLSPLTNDQSWEKAFDLVEEALDEMVQDHWANELLCMADSLGCMPIIERLLKIAGSKRELKEILQTSSRYNELKLQIAKLRN
ncbi:NACHT domain [Penicillium malachiteum]|nr:NACHT domain [Penicillium malachiteum]